MDWNAEYSLFLYLSIYLTINKPKHISDFDTQTLNSTGDFYSSALTVLQKKVNEIKDSCYHLSYLSLDTFVKTNVGHLKI